MNNLPPGVTPNMIPGNRPEDRYTENVLELLCFDPYEWLAEVEKTVTDMIAHGWNLGVSAKTTAELINDRITTRDEDE